MDKKLEIEKAKKKKIILTGKEGLQLIFLLAYLNNFSLDNKIKEQARAKERLITKKLFGVPKIEYLR